MSLVGGVAAGTAFGGEASTGLQQSAGAAAPPPGAAKSDALAAISLSEASARIQARSVTAVELVNACLGRIDVYNPKVNAFITVMREAALAQARTLDAEQRDGKLRGPLHGIPIALKDNIDTAGMRTTAASAVFDDRVPAEDAPVASRLARSRRHRRRQAKPPRVRVRRHVGDQLFRAGAESLGARSQSGGSSGGSAAAVAADLCYAALGTDTGGSIRTPASYCSIVGLKPTHGLVPIRGIIPLVVSLDHCGPMTRTVTDAAMMLNVMAGYDRLDITSVEHPGGRLRQGAGATGRLAFGSASRAARSSTSGRGHRDVDGRGPQVLATLTKSSDRHDAAVHPRRRSRRRDLRLSRGSLREIAGPLHDPDAPVAAERRERQGGRLRPALEAGDAPPHHRRCVPETSTWWCCRRGERTPRTMDAAIKREETDMPRNPELENTQAFNAYGIPTISIPCGFTVNGSAGGVDDCRAALRGRQSARAGPRLRAGHGHHKRKPPIRPDTPVPPLATTEEGAAEKKK